MHRLVSSARQYVRSSLIAQAFAVCFVATHTPILILCAYVASGARISGTAVLVITLLATLLGTGISFVMMRHLLQPLKALAGDLRRYRTDHVVPKFPPHRNDDIGELRGEAERLITALEEQLTRLKGQAFSDVLTGLGNRRWLSEVAATELARARREKKPVAIVIFDLDHFKRINDEFGHEVGDDVLIATADVARRTLRPYDLVARLGGEEFCAILPATTLREAIAIAERLRAGIAAIRLDSLGAHAITASFGVHEADPLREQFRGMLRSADENLYAAKAAGRNLVRSGGATPEPLVR